MRDPIGAHLKNLIRLHRVTNGLVGAQARRADRLFRDIVAELAKASPAEVRGVFRRRRVKKLLKKLAPIVGNDMVALERTLREELVRIGVVQGGWASEQLRRTVGPAVVVDITAGQATSNRFIRAIIREQPFQGFLLKDWARLQGRRVLVRVERQIQLGLSLQETTDQLIRRLHGHRGVIRTAKHEVESVVRTAVNHVVSRAHFEAYQANGRITKKYQWVATLDGRTSLICMGLDGQTWTYDDAKGPKPPAHFRCRSSILPVIDWAGLGISPPPEGSRASVGGQVPSSKTYSDWLRSQPKTAQEEILGPARARLFRAGQVDLRELVRRDRTVVPVSELVPG